MDDHGLSDPWLHSTGDCTAAECMEHQQPRHRELPLDSVTPDLSAERELRPFVWQRGRRLYLLEREQGYWVLAELEFEPGICRYTELRRAFYRWEREAVGALLSRTISFGADAAVESAELLDVWIRHRR